MMHRSPDIVVIGSGMGGATFAAGLAGRGLRVVILERGEHLKAAPENADARAIFQRGHFRPRETWDDGAGRPFNPGNYAYVGGNTKFYGAVLIRYREADFDALEHAEGLSPAWPISYADLEPWYGAAERLYVVRGEAGLDPTEPPRSSGYAHGPVPDEASIAEVRTRMAGAGLRPFTLPLGMDIERWLKHATVPWDAFPNVDDGKSDAETCGLKVALSDPSITLLTGARATRLIAGTGGRIEAVDYEKDGETIRLTPRFVVLAAGAVQSAALLLANGLANRSDQVGRNFMNHNATALIAIDPRFRNRSVYQKTLGLNDFYFSDGNGGPPLGNVQLLGRVTAPILKANVPYAPEWGLKIVADHAVDWYLMSEDLPHPDSRVRLNGDRIVLDWQRTNWGPHVRLAKVMAERCRAAGFPLVLTKTFDRKTPSHQCGTVRMGDDGMSSPVDTQCRAWDHPNLYVVDASVLPTSAAVNPALTVAALALRAADHVLRHELGGAS